MSIPATSLLTAEITLQGTSASGGGGAKNLFNVFHYRRLGVAVDPNKANIAAAFVSDIMPDILLALNARASFTGIGVRFLEDAMDIKQVATVSLVGAVAGDSMPNYVCGTVQLKTALRGRSYMGSKHLGPISEADGGDDVFTGAGLTRFQAVRSVLTIPFVDSDGNTWVPCVVSRKLSQLATNPTTVVRNDVVTAILNKTFGTLRRRKVRTVN
jgi:hypothetical protein